MSIVNPVPFLQNVTDEEAGHTARGDRLAAGAAFAPGSAALSGRSGILPAAAGGRGEVTVINNGTVRVNPFRAVVQGTRSGTQGQYVVTNDAAVDRPIGAQAAGVSRKDLVVTVVGDSAYAPDTADAGDVIVLPGDPAASNPQEPAPGGPNRGNFLVHGVLNVPPTGGSVTFTPRPSLLTVAAGGVRPVDAGDTTAGAHEGQYRHRRGPQWWDAEAEKWRPVVTHRLIRDGGGGGVLPVPGPHTIHAPRTIDAAALFGPGVGALVQIDARVMIDPADGNVGAVMEWSFSIASPALSNGVLETEGSRGQGRRTLRVSYTDEIPADASRSYNTVIGGGSGLAAVTYADPRNNRCDYLITPIYPS